MARSSYTALGLVLTGLALVSLTQCTESKRDLGQGCLRSVDCVSGICAGQICVAQATVFDASPRFDASVQVDASDAASADVVVPHDTSMPPKDTGIDTHKADARDAASEAARDATADADAAMPVDAKPDVVDAKSDVVDAAPKPG